MTSSSSSRWSKWTDHHRHSWPRAFVFKFRVIPKVWLWVVQRLTFSHASLFKFVLLFRVRYFPMSIELFVFVFFSSSIFFLSSSFRAGFTGNVAGSAKWSLSSRWSLWSLSCCPQVQYSLMSYPSFCCLNNVWHSPFRSLNLPSTFLSF